MKKGTIWTIVIVVLILAIGGYALSKRNSGKNEYSSGEYASNSGTQSQQASNQPAQQPAATGQTGILTLNSATSATLGAYLTAANGMTLYIYTPDKPGVSNCTGQCAIYWPPYTVSAAAGLTAATGISGKLGTITRADGTMQLTYNDKPLYFYAKDSKPGDTTGQNVGGIWFVLKP